MLLSEQPLASPSIKNAVAGEFDDTDVPRYSEVVGC